MKEYVLGRVQFFFSQERFVSFIGVSVFCFYIAKFLFSFRSFCFSLPWQALAGLTGIPGKGRAWQALAWPCLQGLVA